MIYLRQFKHVLPRAKAWLLTPDKKLRQLFEGLAGTSEAVRNFVDGVWGDIFPDSTRELTAWEKQFNLSSATGLTDTERRNRLTAAWRAVGGQSPRYLEDVLRGAGFDVYLYEWWEPGDRPAVGVKTCVTPRDPRVLTDFGAAVIVNKEFVTESRIIPQCGEAVAQCGEAVAQCGNFLALEGDSRRYDPPDDPTKWPYFLYVCGPTFGSSATIPDARRDEFEALVLKFKPAHLWVVATLDYETPTDVVLFDDVEVEELLYVVNGVDVADFSSIEEESLEYVYQASEVADFSTIDEEAT